MPNAHRIARSSDCSCLTLRKLFPKPKHSLDEIDERMIEHVSHHTLYRKIIKKKIKKKQPIGKLSCIHRHLNYMDDNLNPPLPPEANAIQSLHQEFLVSNHSDFPRAPRPCSAHAPQQPVPSPPTHTHPRGSWPQDLAQRLTCSAMYSSCILAAASSWSTCIWSCIILSS